LNAVWYFELYIDGKSKPERGLLMDQKNAKRAIVAYATRTGSTAEIAKVIGDELTSKGVQVDVVPVKEVRDVSPYEIVILGTPVRAGFVMPESKRFLKRFKADLAAKKLACFIVCMTMKEDSPKNRETAEKFLGALTKIATPYKTALFGGLMDPSKLSGFWKFAFRKMKVEDGRNWEAIRKWAGEIAE